MKCKCVVCDICNKTIPKKADFIQLKSKHFRFDGYNGVYTHRKYNIDICIQCKDEFKAFVKARNESEQTCNVGRLEKYYK